MWACRHLFVNTLSHLKMGIAVLVIHSSVNKNENYICCCLFLTLLIYRRFNNLHYLIQNYIHNLRRDPYENALCR